MRRMLLALLLASAVTGLLPAIAAAQAPASQAAKPAAPLVNLNTATADQLASLPGIGARTAERIIEYRQKSGPFKKPEDLMNIKGIGEKSFLKLRTLVTVTPPKPERAASQDH